MKMDVAMSSILGEDFSCNVLIFFLVFHGGETINCSLALFVFCLSVCFFNKSLLLFLHSNLKRRKAFSPIAFSLVLSPFY